MSKQYSKYDSYRYQSVNKKYQNSSFWLGNDFLEGQTQIKHDIIKLAAYKRAISNFVRIVTNRTDIKVSYSSGQQSFTDGKDVVISSKISDGEFDCTVGLALHEGSHIALTDFQFLKTAFSLKTYDSQNEFGAFMLDNLHYIKELTNIIEDRRIDYYVYTQSPGYRGYYNSLYDTYFNSKEIDIALKTNLKTSGSIDDYIFHICNFANSNRQLDSMPGLREIWECINLPNIKRLNSTSEVFSIACDVMKLILKHQNTESSNQETTQSESLEKVKLNQNYNEHEDPNLDPSNYNNTEISSNDDSNPIDSQSNSLNSNLSDKEQKKHDKLLNSLEKAFNRQKEFLNGNVKKSKLSAAENAKVNAAAESSISIENVGGSVIDEQKDGSKKEINKGTAQCIVIRGITQSGIDSNLYGCNYSSEEKNYNPISEGIALGTMLGKRLKTRDENRTLTSTRAEHGRIDRRLLAELGFGNDRVFQNTTHYQVTPGLVHISIDGSGSMAGSKWAAAIKSTIAICKAATMISSINVIVSVRSTIHYGSQFQPLMWIVYDSRKDKLVTFCKHAANLIPSGSTPEGLCFQSITSEIIKDSNGKAAFFINLSDGEPSFGNNQINYNGIYALLHTKNQVDNLRKHNIHVQSYFIYNKYRDDWSISNYAQTSSAYNFRTMYGSDSKFIDVTNLSHLANSLNDLFVRGIE
jgi:hypothetical protein